MYARVWNAIPEKLEQAREFFDGLRLEPGYLYSELCVDGASQSLEVRLRDLQLADSIESGLAALGMVSKDGSWRQISERWNPDRTRSDYRFARSDLAVERHMARELPSQRELKALAKAEGIPAISIGAFEGRLINLLLAIQGAKKGVEVGTLGGYSASWISRALGPTGKLYSLELDTRRAQLASQWLSKFGFENVEIRQGDARETLNALNTQGPFDFVFIDADKANYPVYAEWGLKNLRPGGLILADNAYIWGGMLHWDGAGQLPRPSAQSKTGYFQFGSQEFVGMSRLWDIFAKNERLESIILPTGEGLGVARFLG